MSVLAVSDMVWVAIITAIPATVAAILGFVNRKRVAVVDQKQDAQTQTLNDQTGKLNRIEKISNGRLSRALARITTLEKKLNQNRVERRPKK